MYEYIGFMMRTCREINTYKSKLSKIYAGQASTIQEKAAFSYISDFPVSRLRPALRR